MNAFEVIKTLATLARNTGKHIKFTELAGVLNSLGIKTSYNTAYAAGRGTCKLVGDAFRKVMKSDPALADKIAKTFVNEAGKFVY